jgi:Protein of unknown function (DUF3515)
VRTRPSTPVLVAVALPLLLALAVAVTGLVARARGVDGEGLGGPSTAAASAPETTPLAVVPVDAPDADGPRCGLTRPVELTPTAALLEVNGVRWLRLDDGVLDPVVVSWVAVDRPVYVVLTAPPGAGSGPLQAVADAIRTSLEPTPVAVR